MLKICNKKCNYVQTWPLGLYSKKKKRKEKKTSRTTRKSKQPNPSGWIAQTWVNISFRSELWAVSSKCCQVKEEKSMHIFFTDNRYMRTGAKGLTDQSLSRFPYTRHAYEYRYASLDGILDHCRVTPQQYVAGTHLYTWWRETKWRKLPCLRKQCDGQGLNSRPPDSGFEVLTAWTHVPPLDLYNSLVLS